MNVTMTKDINSLQNVGKYQTDNLILMFFLLANTRQKQVHGKLGKIRSCNFRLKSEVSYNNNNVTPRLESKN